MGASTNRGISSVSERGRFEQQNVEISRGLKIDTPLYYLAKQAFDTYGRDRQRIDKATSQSCESPFVSVSRMR